MKDRIDELANLMAEFKLAEAELAEGAFRISFKNRSKAVPQVAATGGEISAAVDSDAGHEEPAPIVDAKPAGTPITSPMTGIYYSAPSPGSPPFVREGDSISAGETIGLIEAMKVFNEIPAPTSGTVLRMVVESGQLVNLGDPLLYIG
jgi:acetyl-CoA carboxylase biotin carboxyl carrier protein